MIIWDEEKNTKLKLDRDISFEEISEIILNKNYLDILESSTRTRQNICVIEYKNYIYAVPFIASVLIPVWRVSVTDPKEAML